MYNIVFSIPIHEKLEVVLDQVHNYLYYNPNSVIVFHLSQGFNYDDSKLNKVDFEDEISKLGNVYLNPESVRTGFADIIQAHISNFKYISSILDFDYFSLCASNELFIRGGLYEHIMSYDYGIEKSSIDTCIYKENIIKDPDLLEFVKGDVSKIYFSHVEGTFYRKTVFSEVISKISSFYDYRKMPYAYPREEVYFATVLWGDESYRRRDNVLKNKLFTFVPWHRKYGKIDVRIREIKKIRNGDTNFYSIKRVSRNYDDYVREYVRKTSYDYSITSGGKFYNICMINSEYKEVRKIIKVHYENIILSIMKWLLGFDCIKNEINNK